MAAERLAVRSHRHEGRLCGQIRTNIARGGCYGASCSRLELVRIWEGEEPSHDSQLRIGSREIEVQLEHVDARLAKNAERSAGRVASDDRRHMIRR
jgi:hypothetical protein